MRIEYGELTVEASTGQGATRVGGQRLRGLEWIYIAKLDSLQPQVDELRTYPFSLEDTLSLPILYLVSFYPV